MRLKSVLSAAVAALTLNVASAQADETISTGEANRLTTMANVMRPNLTNAPQIPKDFAVASTEHCLMIAKTQFNTANLLGEGDVVLTFDCRQGDKTLVRGSISENSAGGLHMVLFRDGMS